MTNEASAQAALGRRPNKAELWPEHGPCALCGTVGPLCRSHIIPKFVGVWKRATSVTGRLRSADTPNKLVQDLPWRYMLCPACEGRFSVFEDEVCRTIFLPIHERTQSQFRYGPSFCKFAASVVWRALLVQKRESGSDHVARISQSVDAAESAWRSFLLSQRSTPAPHVLHALPLDVPSNLDTSRMSPHWARFVLRTVATGSPWRAGAGYISVKMARLLVFGTVAPGKERKEWKATQLHVEGGSWGADCHAPIWVVSYVDAGARRQDQAADEVSAKQRRRSNESAWKALNQNSRAVAESDVFRAFEADLRLFGDKVLEPPPDDEPSR